jgi:hypothetical protein
VAVTVEIANDFLVTVMDIVEVMIFVLLTGVMLIVQGAVADGEVTVIWADVCHTLVEYSDDSKRIQS